MYQGYYESAADGPAKSLLSRSPTLHVICSGFKSYGIWAKPYWITGDAPIQRLRFTPKTRGSRQTLCEGQSWAPAGSKNRATLLAEALTEGEKEALLRTAVEIARAGNVPMLKFLLGRIMPRDRLVRLDLPEMTFADDGVETLGCIMRAVSEGAITPSEGAALAAIIKSYTDAIDLADAVKRLDVLEAKIKAA